MQKSFPRAMIQRLSAIHPLRYTGQQTKDR